MNEAELFDLYLQDRLKTSDKLAFERRLLSDKSFADEFRLFKEVDKAILQKDLMAFRSKLESIQPDHNNQAMKKTNMQIDLPLDNELDDAILQHDVMALREQLDQIHASYEEEVDAHGIPGYIGIDKAISDQNSIQLREELNEFASHNELGGLSETEKLYQEVDAAILQTDIIDLREKLSTIGDFISKGEKKILPVKAPRLRLISAAAAILIIALVSSVFLINNSGAVSPMDLSYKYFPAYDAGGNTRGLQSEPSYLERGLQQYREGDYITAKDYLLMVPDKDQYVTFYLGMTSMLNNQIDQAIGYFKQYIESNETSFGAASEFYLLGCYLRQNKLDEAKALVDKIISKGEGDYYEEVKNISKKLKS